MAKILTHVSFPLQGESPMLHVRDRFPLRLFSLGGCVIDERWGGGSSDMSSPFWRLYFNLDDGAEVHTQGTIVLPLAAGALVVVPAWLSWRAHCRGNVRHGNAFFDLPALRRERVREHMPRPLVLAAPGEPLAAAWARFFRDIAAAPALTVKLESQGHALIWSALEVMFERTAPELSVTARDTTDAGLAQALYWAETNLDQRIGRRELAEHANLSEAELARRFQEELGTSPARWVRERRISFAAELLRQTDEPVERIAERTGLGDRAHFSRVFARWCGQGPASWRKAQRSV
ncbi:MAG: helix-turn-helix transcriptional regulator [Spirochaetes bacterium]|nr:helix-turn-helix transcriptional regulator [Spirochaetota bacterium]